MNIVVNNFGPMLGFLAIPSRTPLIAFPRPAAPPPAAAPIATPAPIANAP